MDVVTLTGATILKFHRSEKKWKEKGRGNVTFLLKGDELMVGVGKQSFFVKGGLRPKGPNAIVMRVWGIEARSEDSDMILAVRFGKQRDSERLAKLSERMLDKRKVKMPRTSQWPEKPHPRWFSSLEKSKRNSIQNLIRNADPKYLKDGTIRMQLVKMYELSPTQIEQLFDFFHPWRALSNMPNTSITNGKDELSTKKQRPHNRLIMEDSNLPLSPLTEQNLFMYNRLRPPLKGHFRTIVRTWLDKSLPSEYEM